MGGGSLGEPFMGFFETPEVLLQEIRCGAHARLVLDGRARAGGTAIVVAFGKCSIADLKELCVNGRKKAEGEEGDVLDCDSDTRSRSLDCDDGTKMMEAL